MERLLPTPRHSLRLVPVGSGELNNAIFAQGRRDFYEVEGFRVTHRYQLRRAFGRPYSGDLDTIEATF